MILTYERSEDGKQPHVEQKCKVFMIKGLIEKLSTLREKLQKLKKVFTDNSN